MKKEILKGILRDKGLLKLITTWAHNISYSIVAGRIEARKAALYSERLQVQLADIRIDNLVK